MSALILIIAFLVWLGAAYAFVRMGLSVSRIYRAAPAGQKWNTMVELWSLNYPAVRQRVAEAVAPDVERISKHLKLFVGCVITLVALVATNIISGNAA